MESPKTGWADPAGASTLLREVIVGAGSISYLVFLKPIRSSSPEPSGKYVLRGYASPKTLVWSEMGNDKSIPVDILDAIGEGG